MSSSETIPVRHAWIEPGVEGVLFTAARSGSGGHIIPVTRAKQGPTPKRVAGRGTVPATHRRRYHDQGHQPPAAGLRTADDTLWKGASRIVNPAAKRRANRTSWKKLGREWRLQAMERA